MVIQKAEQWLPMLGAQGEDSLGRNTRARLSFMVMKMSYILIVVVDPQCIHFSEPIPCTVKVHPLNYI